MNKGDRDEEEDLTELRWPRSSGGSLRSLTASMTVDRRSTSFFSALEDVLDDDDGDNFDEEEEEEEAHLGLDPPLATSAADLRFRYHVLGDVAVVRASRVAMFEHEWKLWAFLKTLEGRGLYGLLGG